MRTVEYSQRTVERIVDMNTAIEAVKSARADGRSYNDKGGLMDKAKAAVKAVNASITEDAIRDILAIGETSGVTAMMESYLQDWTVAGRSVKDGDKGIELTEDKPLRILFSDLDAAATTKIATKGNWMKIVDIFIHHCNCNWAKQDGEAALLTLPNDLRDLYPKLGSNWVDDKGKPKYDKTSLGFQFNDIVKAILPADMAKNIFMNGAAVRNFSTAVRGYKRTTVNAAMTFKIAGGKTAEEVLFDAIYTRKNNLAVKFEDSLTREDNSKKPGSGDKPAAGGDVKTTPAEGNAVEKSAEKPAEK